MKNKNYIRHAPCLRNSIAYDHDFWYARVKWWYLRVFFSFFLNFDFPGCKWVKGQTIAQNDKKFCLSRSISQEPYIIWSSFVVHKCKVIISSGNFFSFFQNFGFLGCWEGQRAKHGPKMTKNCPLHFVSKEPYILWSWFLVHMCERVISPGVFLHFFQIFNFGMNSGVTQRKMA